MVKLEVNFNRDLGTFVVIERSRDLDAEEKEARRCSQCREVHNDDVRRLVLSTEEVKKLRDLLNALFTL